MLCFKVEMNVSIPAEQTFRLLSDLTKRKEWDRHYESVKFTFLASSPIWQTANYVQQNKHDIDFLHSRDSLNNRNAFGMFLKMV